MADQSEWTRTRNVVAGTGVLVLLIATGIWLYSTGKLGYVGLTPSSAIWLAFIVIFLILGALAFLFLALKSSPVAVIGGDVSSAPNPIEQRTLRSVVIGAGILVTVTFVWAGGFVAFRSDNSEVSLPVVIIAGLVVLITALGLLTFVFSELRLSDSKEALGLPSGSVRAVIALMLLVVFAIVAIFLYSDISSNSRLQSLTVDAAKVNEVKKHVDYVFEVDEKDGRKTVYYRSGSRAAEDLAKQLIVLLGTLVTAVSSFYFGSNSIAAATKAAASTGGPNAKTVRPSNLAAGGSPHRLEITGANLSNVVTVKLTFEKEEPIVAEASTIVASDTNVTCSVTTSTTSRYGPWTLVVTDNANNDSRIPDSVTIGSAPAKPVTSPRAPDLKADDSEQQLDIETANVPEAVKSVQLTHGSDTLKAVEGKTSKTATGVVCFIRVPKGTPHGEWDVALVGSDDQPIPVKDKKVTIG